MNVTRQLRLRAVAVTIALVASVVTVTATSGASASPPAATAGAAASAGAPDTAGSASAFALFLLHTPQPVCSGPGLDVTADPYMDRKACGFLNFTPTNVTGALSAELYAEGSSTPFATLAVTTPAQAPELRRVSLQPANNWPSGQIRLVIKEGPDPIGEFGFGHNVLAADLATSRSTPPNTPFTVTGTIGMHSARTTFSDEGVPAAFTLKVLAPNGSVRYTKAVTAGSNGEINETIPASATSGLSAGPKENYRTTVSVQAVDATYNDSTPVTGTGAWTAKTAATASHTVQFPATQLILRNLFSSAVGWVKPGQTYPSRIVVSNPTARAIRPRIDLTAPTGTQFLAASGPGKHPVAAKKFTWSPGAIARGATVSLLVRSKAASTSKLPTIVWRDLSTKAVLKVGGKVRSRVASHGPKVIPPSEIYDSARYGDRPFPMVPVQYTDRKYQPNHTGDSLEKVLNDPDYEGSTFNLWQENSLGQLFPQGTVPSAGIASAGFDYAPGFEFTTPEAQNTCRGATFGPAADGIAGTPLYPERITNGVYNLPGQTEYYGSDSFGSAYVTAQTPAGIQDIDSGCGDTGKLVYDAAVIADPEIDYSDYDTDKDGVVDFFMVVFAGCGGNGSSQVPGNCPYESTSYDNVWPHSSSLESGYSDPVTKLPGYTTDDQLKDHEGRPLWYESKSYGRMTTKNMGDDLKVFVRVGPYNVNPETAIDKASVISHEYGHSLGLPDFYSGGSRETYGDWNLMATDKSQNMDAYVRQEMGWVVPEVLTENRTVTIEDSKQDTGVIKWRTKSGKPYTLRASRKGGNDGVVHNSQMYVAKLPGFSVLEPNAFETGDKASKSHVWWSGSGNDFGCTPTGGRNFDLLVPELAKLDSNAVVTLSLKHLWDIEWDYDYGFVLTTTDGGATYTSNPSEEGYTTQKSPNGNPNNNGCQDLYDNGLTGNSGSYALGPAQVAIDRTPAGSHPDPVFLEDSYDISELAGAAQGALRFSYSTDPGLALPGWFIDDVKITVDPDGSGAQPAREVFATDFESSGGPNDLRVFNGGCRENLTTSDRCSRGWSYLQGGEESEQDHAYYMEMRDRSGFDLDGENQIDRSPIGFQAGFYLAYTNEAHGYGNVGTDDPPAQSPLDAVPQPGENAPNLNDAAFVPPSVAANRDRFTDSGANHHVDNYEVPTAGDDKDTPSGDGLWHFNWDCLTFKVNSMQGNGDGPEQADGDLKGNVSFTLGPKCGRFNYGYETGAADGPAAKIKVKPKKPFIKSRVKLSGAKSVGAGLKYAWNFGNGGKKKDSTKAKPKVRFKTPGYKRVSLTVTDSSGRKDTSTERILVRRAVKCGSPRVGKTGSWRKVRSLNAPNGKYCDNLGSGRGADTLTYQFRGPQIDVYHGKVRGGGKAAVYVDGKRRGTIDFSGKKSQLRFKSHHVVKGLSKGRHTVRVVILRGRAYIASFISIR